MKSYRLADINIGLLENDLIFQGDERADLFRNEGVDESEIEKLFHIENIDQKEIAESQCLQITGGYELLKTEKGLFLLNHWGSCRTGYGIRLDDLYKGSRIPVYVNPELKNQIPINIVRFMGTIGLHSVLLMENAPILHASNINYKGKAILFTASSGTGKSTQADLWKKFAGAEIVNGDRVLVKYSGQQWQAYGYPCCGSSMICKNLTSPIAVIVALQKGTENKIEELTYIQKVRTLVSATEVYLWERREIDKALTVAENLIAQVPVVRLICRPDSDAVEVLKAYLEEKGYV